MVVCLKLKKAFRKPSADCSSAGTFITHLCSKSSSLISRDGGKENRGNQKDLKKNNRVCSWVLFFSCALSVFSSWIIHVLSGVSFPTSVNCAQNSQRWAKREWAKQSPHKLQTSSNLWKIRGDSTDPALFYFEIQMTAIFQTTCKYALRVTCYLSLKYKHAQVHCVPRAGCGCAQTTSRCLPENFMLGALRLSKGYDPAL